MRITTHLSPITISFKKLIFVICLIIFVAIIFPVASIGSDHNISKGVIMANKSQPNQGQIDDETIVIVGASYAAGLLLSGAVDQSILIKGVGGEQSFEMLARYQSDVMIHKPKAVIFWGFINDIFRADRDKMPAALDRIKKSYREIVRLSLDNGITPILATEVTMGPRGGLKELVVGWIAGLIGKTSYQEFINKYVMDINNWLKIYAADQNLLILNFQQLLADNDGSWRKRKYAQEDGSHISEKGYDVISEYINENLQTIISKHRK